MVGGTTLALRQHGIEVRIAYQFTTDPAPALAEETLQQLQSPTYHRKVNEPQLCAWKNPDV